MMRLLTRARRDERGATLILVIAFMLVMGGIGAAVTSSVTSGLNGRIVLDKVRNEQYAADGGVELAIAQVRAKALPENPGMSPCGPDSTHDYYRTVDYFPAALNGVDIRIDCANQLGAATTTGSADVFLQRNVIFTACVDTGTKCGQPTTPIVVRAQVNFEAHKDIVDGKPALDLTRTWVQSWSVNR